MAAGGSGEVVIVPRNFVLLEELEKTEKGNTDMSTSYGLVQSDDITLSHWQCTILGPPASAVPDRIISLMLHCGPNYPSQPPHVKFQTKVNFPFVVRRGDEASPSPPPIPPAGFVAAPASPPPTLAQGPDGAVNPSKFPLLANWQRSNRIEHLLVELKKAMTKQEYKKLQQPPEGVTYD